MSSGLIELVRDFYSRDQVGLHEPHFDDAESAKLKECIDSGFVSSVGQFVTDFEKQFANYTGSPHAIAVVNGTCGLQVALKAVGVNQGDKVVVPNITFIATSNAVRHSGATPIYLDIEKENVGLCPKALAEFFETQCEFKNDVLTEKKTGARIAACMPVHIFGNPCLISEIVEVCEKYNVACVEDAAEALGSYENNKHVGLTGDVAVFSFNGNKVLTTGGGGMIVTEDEALAKRLKHLTTTARVPDGFNFLHDDFGYNFRMPNLNAALGIAQLEKLDHFLNRKNQLRESYENFFKDREETLIASRENTRANNWLNAVLTESREKRDQLLEETNAAGIMTRPLWTPMANMKMNSDGVIGDYPNSNDMFDRIVCLPSGPY